MRSSNIGGCNDWFIASKAEHDKLNESNLVSWYDTECVYSCVELDESWAYLWYIASGMWETTGWKSHGKQYFESCFGIRAF